MKKLYIYKVIYLNLPFVRELFVYLLFHHINLNVGVVFFWCISEKEFFYNFQ